MLERKNYYRGGTMVELEEKFYRGIAGKFGLPLQFAYKEHKIMQLLEECIVINNELKLNIIMKGGTALNKVYFGETQRFSEDIDFDYLGDKTEKEKLQDLDSFLKKIRKFSIAGPWQFYDTVRYHCLYKFINQNDYVRLEFNIGEKAEAVDAPVLLPVTSGFLGIAQTGLYIYAFDDLVARKMHALKDRCEGKDIWDSFYALQKTKNIKKAISKMLEKEKQETNADLFLKECIEKLQKADVKKLLKDTNSYIPVYLRPKSWQEMVKTLIAKIDLLIEG